MQTVVRLRKYLRNEIANKKENDLARKVIVPQEHLYGDGNFAPVSAAAAYVLRSPQ